MTKNTDEREESPYTMREEDDISYMPKEWRDSLEAASVPAAEASAAPVPEAAVADEVAEPAVASAEVRQKPAEARVSNRDKVLDVVSTALSWIFVPLLTPVYAIILIFSVSSLAITSPLLTRFTVSSIIFGLNCILPMVLIFLFKKMGLVSDIALNRRRERALPYLVVIMCYVFSGQYLYSHGAPSWVTMFYAGGALTAVVNFTVNFRWKISAHAAAMGGVFYVLVRIANATPTDAAVACLIAWALLTGLLGGARIWLRRHTLLQVLAGFANGYLCVWLMSRIQY